jgi:hypothetical protein
MAYSFMRSMDKWIFQIGIELAKLSVLICLIPNVVTIVPEGLHSLLCSAAVLSLWSTEAMIYSLVRGHVRGRAYFCIASNTFVLFYALYGMMYLPM